MIPIVAIDGQHSSYGATPQTLLGLKMRQAKSLNRNGVCNMTLAMNRNIPQPSTTKPAQAAPGAANVHVSKWVQECVEMCGPDQVVWCDGSVSEKEGMLKRAVSEGVLIELNEEKLPNCYLHRSNPNDVARTEGCTFICTPGQDMVGPTNNWMEHRAAYAKLRDLFRGCMAGRTMYVIPFIMGPLGSPLAKVGVQVTDSIYVAISMGIMTRMGDVAWKQLGDTDEF